MKSFAFHLRQVLLLSFFVAVLGFQATQCRADLWGISTDREYSRVIRFNPVTGDELPGGIPKTISPPLPAPSGIAIDSNNRIYVSSRGDQSAMPDPISPKILIYSCDQAGNCAPDTLSGGTTGVFADFGTSGAAPSVLRFAPNGDLYVSELFGQNVRTYDPATGARGDDAASSLPGTGGIAFKANGNSFDLLVGTVAVPDFMIPATISRFSGGQQQAPFFVASLGELVFPASLLPLPNGDLLAVDLFTDRIERFSSSGEDLGTFATIPTIIEGKPSFPSDIVFDPDGNLIVSVLGPNNFGEVGGNQGQLRRYNLNGDLLEVIADELEQIGGLAWTPSLLTLAGNYDGVGGVDAADYSKWRSDFGKFVAPGNGADGNRNGVVDAADYSLWRRAASEGLAAAATVPEPAAGLLLLAAAVTVVAAHHRRLFSHSR